MAEASQQPEPTDTTGHPGWVRVCHWLVALSFLALAVSGYVILMCHPCLYWGEVGNGLTPALIELPISRNHDHGQWAEERKFAEGPDGAVSAVRNVAIFNQNSWARSLHFLAAWIFVLPGAVYLFAGIRTGHFRRNFWPEDFSMREFGRDLMHHVRLRRAETDESRYGLLQKCAYCGVVFVALPLVVVSGLAMSPTITASYPVLNKMFGGFQSARTVHFFAAVVLVLFLIVHVVMVIRTGFRRQMRSMTFGRSR